MSISFYTTEELIKELTNRTTFAGIVIQSDKEVRSRQHMMHENWDITYSNLTALQVHDLLIDTVEHFKQLAETESQE